MLLEGQRRFQEGPPSHRRYIATREQADAWIRGYRKPCNANPYEKAQGLLREAGAVRVMLRDNGMDPLITDIEEGGH